MAVQARAKTAWIPSSGNVVFGFDTAMATEFFSVCFRLFWKRAIRGKVYKKENTRRITSNVITSRTAFPRTVFCLPQNTILNKKIKPRAS